MTVAAKETVSDRQTALFCKNLSLQLHAGIPMAEGIHLLAQDEDPSLGGILLEMGAGLDRGEGLDEVLEQAGCFPEYVPAMVKIGQQTGKLEQTLDALGAFYDRRDQQKRQLGKALAYPCMVFVLMLVVVAVLLIKVLPVFDGIYASLGSRLTGVAGWLLQLGAALEKALPVLAVILAAGLVLGLLYFKIPGIRSRVNHWYRSRFADRGIGRKFSNARFAQALAMGLSSGLSLEESIALAENLLKEIPGAARRCRQAAQALEQGEPLAQALQQARLLPPAESRMLTVGLRGGNADQVMEQIARRLSDQAEEALEDRAAGIEPALVLLASGLVGIILLSVMLPLMNIMAAIG